MLAAFDQNGGENAAIVLDYARVPLIVSSGAIGEEDIAAAVAMAEGKEPHAVGAVQRLPVAFDRRGVCTGEGTRGEGGKQRPSYLCY